MNVLPDISSMLRKLRFYLVYLSYTIIELADEQSSEL